MEILKSVFEDLIIKLDKVLNDLDSMQRISTYILISNEVMISYQDDVLRVIHGDGLIMFKSDIIQRQFNKGHVYRSDIVDIIDTGVSFFDIKTEEEFFQYNTMIDFKFLNFEHILILNAVREYMIDMLTPRIKCV